MANRKTPKGQQAPKVQPVALSATPNAAANATQPPVPLGKYRKAAQALGIGYLGAAGAAMFTLGAWPRNPNHSAPPASGQPAQTVPQALWLAAQAAGATATNAVSGLQIAVALLTPGTAANATLQRSAAATRVIKGQRYAANGQPVGLWVAGYIGPKASAAAMAKGVLRHKA